jgi:hypothetical protein
MLLIKTLNVFFCLSVYLCISLDTGAKALRNLPFYDIMNLVFGHLVGFL